MPSTVAKISCLVACSARIVVDRQTDKQTDRQTHRTRTTTVTLAAHARRRSYYSVTIARVNNYYNFAHERQIFGKLFIAHSLTGILVPKNNLWTVIFTERFGPPRPFFSENIGPV